MREPRARKLTKLQVEQLFGELAKTWRTKIAAGSLDPSIGLASSGEHSCAAVGTWDSMQQGKIPGRFSSEHLHAEMDVLDKVYQNGTADEVAKIEIETQPCPRCAVILNLLGLGGKVFYKSAGGFKDYPTWRFPDLWMGDDGLAELLGVPEEVDSQAKAEILTLFRTIKWW